MPHQNPRRIVLVGVLLSVALNAAGQILFKAFDGDDSGMWRKDSDGSLIPLYHAGLSTAV